MLKIQPENKGANMVKPGVRLCLTKDRDALVPADHPDAATLWCTESDEVPKAEFEQFFPPPPPEPEPAAEPEPEPQPKQKASKKRAAKKGAKK